MPNYHHQILVDDAQLKLTVEIQINQNGFAGDKKTSNVVNLLKMDFVLRNQQRTFAALVKLKKIVVEKLARPLNVLK